jgi:hypothetical protein
MSDDYGKAVWRVAARDGAAHEHAFDALVVVADDTTKLPIRRHVGVAVPFEGELEDVPLTMIVHARPEVGPIVVDYCVYGSDGSGRVCGRSTQQLAVIVRSATGILVTGLPGPGDQGGALGAGSAAH